MTGKEKLRKSACKRANSTKTSCSKAARSELSCHEPVFAQFTVLMTWASEGGGRGALALYGFWNLTFSWYIFSKKGYFLTFESEKWNFTTFTPPWKRLFGYLRRNPLEAYPPEKILPTSIPNGCSVRNLWLDRGSKTFSRRYLLHASPETPEETDNNSDVSVRVDPRRGQTGHRCAAG